MISASSWGGRGILPTTFSRPFDRTLVKWDRHPRSPAQPRHLRLGHLSDVLGAGPARAVSCE